MNAAGTNCNFLGRSQVPAHYALRGTLRNFRIYDRALSADEAIALSRGAGCARACRRTPRRSTSA